MPETLINAVLAARLLAARTALGISQAELGTRMGLPEDVASTRINRYEKARHSPDLATAEKLAAELGIPLPALIARDDKMAHLIVGFALLSKTQQDAVLDQLNRALGAKKAKRVRAQLDKTTVKATAPSQAGKRRL